MTVEYPPVGVPGLLRLWVQPLNGPRRLLATKRFRFPGFGVTPEMVVPKTPYAGVLAVEAGLRTRHGKWFWVRLPVPRIDLVVGQSLTVNPTYITVTYG